VRLMPLVSYSDTGDDFLNELIVLGVSPATISILSSEINQYVRSLNNLERRKRAKILLRIRKEGK